MKLALLRKNIRDAAWLWLALALAMVSFNWLRVYLVSQLDTETFRQIVNLLPENFKRFSPVDFDWASTYPGRISFAFDEPLVVACVVIWAIARGSDAVSGELGRGSMEMLLAQPLSRRRILLTQALVTTLGVVLLAACAWLGTFIGIHATEVREQRAPRLIPAMPLPFFQDGVPNPFAKPEIVRSPMRHKVDPLVLLPASVNLGALGLFFCGLSTLVSAFDRYRWRTIGLMVGFFIVQGMIEVLGRGAPQFEWARYGTVFAAYEPEVLAQIAARQPEHAWSWFIPSSETQPGRWGPMFWHALLAGLGGVFYLGALTVFCRRDLPAPL